MPSIKTSQQLYEYRNIWISTSNMQNKCITINNMQGVLCNIRDSFFYDKFTYQASNQFAWVPEHDLLTLLLER